MRETGIFNPSCSIKALGVEGASAHYNLEAAGLTQAAIARGEAELAVGGALVALTGQHTGRSPKDKFVAREPSVAEAIWWENNPPMTPEAFETLRADMISHLAGKDLFVQDLFCGAAPEHRISVRFVNELAWHMLFIRNMMRRPNREEVMAFEPGWTVINAPSFKADPARHGCRSETVIALSFERRTVLIGNTSYAGENKKSIFSIMNFLLPEKGVMPMHCSANHAPGDPSDSAVFFGLSGTGKTTLSADPGRTLIGDDEHGWAEDALFNFEGGCYAKTINLSQKSEPEIYATTSMFGSVLENVVMDPVSRVLDFDDARHTENTRVCYPLHFIPNASQSGLAGPPKNVFMLTCDAFGVLPPIARLTPAQAMYHFLSGFTAKVAGTEKGVTEPEPTFSTCFGAPFMPRRPEVYGALLRDKIAKDGAACWLVSTGWTGGPHGVGKRMPIRVTRALLTAALDGSLNQAEFRRDPNFGFEVPTDVDDVSSPVLNPRQTWADPAAYDAKAAELLRMFEQNFAKHLPHVDDDVRAAALKAP